MKFVQEGVFDKVKAEPTGKMPLKDLTASNIQSLSSDEVNEYIDYWRPRRNRIWKTMNELDKKKRQVKDTYSADFASSPKRGFTKDKYNQYGSTWIRAGSDAERLMDQIEGDYEVYSEKYDMYSDLGAIFGKEQKRRENLQKKEGRNRASTDWPAYQQEHPENRQGSIPPKIARAAGLKPSLANPYFGRKGKALEKQYAGHPAHYPYWSNDWKRRIMAMDEFLKNGNQELEMMYAGTFYNSGNRFNFMIVGAGGNFLWRKYDPSPGAGQNHVYLNGKKMKTTTLESWIATNPEGRIEHAEDKIKSI